MTVKVILCAVVGQKWAPAKDTFDAHTALACGRCGRRQTLSAESRQIEGYGRGRRVR